MLPAQTRHMINMIVMTLLMCSFACTACAQRDDESSRTANERSTEIKKIEDWPKPRSTERLSVRHAMVARQIEARGVRDAQVLSAMRNVPRHWFMPEGVQHLAYADRPAPIGRNQTISQPYIVAYMTEALNLTAQSKVLEIGTGSGYQAAVLAEITPYVYTIEIVKPLGERAIETFKKRGYETIVAKIGDGYAGWKEHAPFDAVIVTCAPESVPKPLIEQLAVGGRICIPVGDEFGIQSLRLLTKKPDGSIDSRDLMPVRFVPMTGQAQNDNRSDN